jgi:hypothetical protein
MDKTSNSAIVNIVKGMFAIRNKWDHKVENIKTNMYVRVMNFQRWIVRIIHCCCIEGCIYHLKKVYFLCYLHQNSTWHESWIIKKRISKELITSLITQSAQGYLHYPRLANLHNDSTSLPPFYLLWISCPVWRFPCLVLVIARQPAMVKQETRL